MVKMPGPEHYGDNSAVCRAGPLKQTMLEQEVDDRDLGYVAVQLLFPDKIDQTFPCGNRSVNGESKRANCDLLDVEMCPVKQAAQVEKRPMEDPLTNTTVDKVVPEQSTFNDGMNNCGGRSSSNGTNAEDDLSVNADNGMDARGCRSSLKRPLDVSDDYDDHLHEQAEYDILDDLMNDDDDRLMSSDDEKGWGDSDDEADEDNEDHVPEDEIDALLDEKLDEYREGKRARRDVENDEMAHEEREKVVLKVRGQDHFEVLPEGWIEVTHNSGMPIYLHKKSRVCTLSKPYFLGPGSARKHEAPIAAIPCLQYRQEIEKEKQKKCPMAEQLSEPASQPDATNEESMAEVVKVDEVTGSDSNSAERVPNMLTAKIETVQENTKEKSIDYLELRNYCQRLFEFKTIKVRRFKTWAGRRKHQKKMKQMHRPTLPLGTKLITCPLPPSTDKEEGPTTNPRRAEFVMNPNGKSYVCILHEYVQHAMRVQPRYLFRELDNCSAPYGASVVINDMEYGFGFGSSKKQAKLDAAKATLEILIPQMKYINPDEKEQGVQQQDLALFDEIRVEDPRVSELCAKAGQLSPYQILLECLKRNYGLGDTQIKFEMQMLKHQKNKFTMSVGKHKVSVVCKNKRDGKQSASQGILQLLHTHITSWGSLLRLYGKGSCKTLKEKKQEEQQITELQCRTTANRPNQSILCKLRIEMLKLKEKRNSRKPIGKFVPTDLEPPSSSGSNLRNVDL